MPNVARLEEAIHTLSGILQQQKDSGKDGILLSEEHLDILKNLPREILKHNTLSAPAPSPTINETAPPDDSVQDDPEFLARGIERLVAEGQNNRERLNYLARLVKEDAGCRALGTLRETMVFATGNPEAQLMLVGEAPGAEEERQHKPFVGPAGQLLDRITEAIGLAREEVYISNIVKYRPKVFGAQTGNRKPDNEEIDAFLKYIMAEIDVVQPDLIIAFGATAAQGLLGSKDSVGTMRGRSYSLKGIPVVVTYHPSYLLHCKSSSPEKFKAEKRKVWTDMQKAMKILGLPSST